ncbi:MAG: choice-of-anchor D domain-containing protein [Bradymonadaceae bacterium]|nr:choice-of-anchor D domain-containing protein [Lujinxingiaceae bacterium]
MLVRLSILFSFLLLGAACGPGDVGKVETAVIQVSPLSVAFSQVNLGESATEDVTVLNLSQNELVIQTLALESNDGGAIGDLKLLGVGPLPVRVPAGGDFIFQVEYSPTTQSVNKGRIRILGNDPRYSATNPLFVNVDTLASRPQLDVRPASVRFARMLPGGRAEQTLQIINVGSAPLILHEAPVYTGGGDFRIELPNRTYPLSLKVYDAALEATSPQDYVLDINVVYAPAGANADTGEVLIVSNDVRDVNPNDPTRGLRKVVVQANADAPCILVDGRTRNLGQVPIGGNATDIVTVSNCGTQPLNISSIAVTEGTAFFELNLGSWDANGDGRIDNPIILAPSANTTFAIQFTPEQPATERGKVVISSNDPVQPELELDLVARGSDGVCPIAVATGTIKGVSSTARTELSAVPLQYIVLDGRQSSDPDGSVVSYDWEVLEKPSGTIVTLGPVGNSTDTNRREFRLFTAGTYKIGLNVVDNEGFRSCEQAVVTIQAIPNQKVHIELTWTNPSDPDESDNTGSDLDLHLTKMGPGRWFLVPYDVFYNNANPGKGAIWSPESPSLDIDVTSGAGPENITLDNPEECQWYAIGVHYFREQFGTAYATVRVYINTQLVYERLHMRMSAGGQFWDVARIHWQNGQATIFDVDTLYPASLAGHAPEIIEDMKESGLCTSQSLY